MIRVLIVDDHAMFAESVARLLEREDDMVVAGIATTSIAALAMAERTRPDVAIVDYGLPDADGARTTAGIRAASPETSVLVLTGLADDGVASAAIQAGCVGFLTKDKASRELAAAVRSVSAGEAYIPPYQVVDLHRGLSLEKMKSEFVSRIAHEFRTPLTAILGSGRLLACRDITGEDSHRLGEQIVASSERLQRIVELLELTAASACGLLTAQIVVDPRVLIDDAINRWATRVGEAHTIEHGASFPLAEVMADRRWLAMALDELIDNAVKFSPSGGKVVVTAMPA